jgi:hypothetical protein
MADKQRQRATQIEHSPAPTTRASHQSAPVQLEPDKSATETLSPQTQRILQIQRTVGNQAVLRMLGKRPETIQRAFQPARTTSKTHLRSGPGALDVDTQIGRNIPSGTEIVVDQAQQQIQNRKIINNVTWTRAVDVTGAAWDPVNGPGLGGYVRNNKIRLKDYNGLTNDVNVNGTVHQNKPVMWNPAVGEYTRVSLRSWSDDTASIIKTGANFPGDYKRLSAANVMTPLDALEELQMDPPKREREALIRLKQILRDAATDNNLDPAVVATDESARKLLNPLRITLGKGTAGEVGSWNAWSANVFQKIENGAEEAMASIAHWLAQLTDPLRPGSCRITEVEIEGSDLHDHGLGAMFVKFSKPAGGTGVWPDKTDFKVVIKPEDRSLEKSLFGTQAGSLANQVNQLAGLDPADEITRIRMETHDNFGSLIEFVRGQQARGFNGTEAPNQAMSEGIAFAFLAGMSDVHQDNVIWKDGKPYFIDADNSLNAARLQNATSQTGFSKFNTARTNEDLGHINNTPDQSRSRIIASLLENSTPLLDAVRAAYDGHTGRVVPIYTEPWAMNWKLRGFITNPVGLAADMWPAQRTRHGTVNEMASVLPDGSANWRPVPTEAPRLVGHGLAGESGVAGTGRNYNAGVDKAQIMADLNEGKIPFYSYEYTTGFVKHNNVRVWDGQSLDDAMNVLLAKFPAPVDDVADDL